MIKVENIVPPSPQQWLSVTRGVRNPMNSWDKSDSKMFYNNGWDPGYYEDKNNKRLTFREYEAGVENKGEVFVLGKKDLKLMTNLANAGSDHGKFLRQLPVICEITAPLYWWKQWDTYKVGTTANSCSTMHRLTEREFTFEDFSLDTSCETDEPTGLGSYENVFGIIIGWLNDLRNKYLETEDKKYWKTIVEYLPESYNQKRTVSLNYAVLRNMYHQRKNHKLPEWQEFFRQLFSDLDYAEELIVGE